MVRLTRPKFFIPMHGTLRHLIHHARLASETGVRRAVVITNGEVAQLDPAAAGGFENSDLYVLPNRVTQGKVFIDSESEEVPDIVVRDRQHLAEDGFVVVVVAVDSDGRLVRDPEIITRGLMRVDASQELLEDVRKQLVGMFSESRTEELRDADLLQEKVRALLKRYFRKNMGRRPLVLPVIWEM